MNSKKIFVIVGTVLVLLCLAGCGKRPTDNAEVYGNIIANLDDEGAYAEYESYKKIHDESKSLSGLKKWKFDKEHVQDLVQYDMAREELKSLLSGGGGKITPKAWRAERREESL